MVWNCSRVLLLRNFKSRLQARVAHNSRNDDLVIVQPWHQRVDLDQSPAPVGTPQNDSKNDATVTAEAVSFAQRHFKPLLITMSLELYCETRRDLLPNPKVESDRPRVAMYEVVEANYTSDSEDINRYCGCVVLLEPSSAVDSGGPWVSDHSFKRAVKSALIPLDTNRIAIAHSEHEFFSRFATIVRKIDPDYFIGYDVQGASWGWLISRGWWYGSSNTLW